MIEHKSVKAELKQAGEGGGFEAVIATFGKVDSDGDVVEPGAFNGATVSIVPAHDHGSVPLGKAKIEERGDKAIAVGRFNLSVGVAKDWHEAIKFDIENPPAVQEWSWAFHINNGGQRMEERGGEEVRILTDLDLMEVSPVLRGASVGTGTLSAKSRWGSHETETSDAPWDAAREAKRLKAEDLPGFPHHFAGEDGELGPASVRACLKGIARLKGDEFHELPDPSARRRIYQHLASHLKDAEVEVPDLSEKGLRLADQVRIATWDVEAAVARIREVSDARMKRDQDLSDDAKAMAIEMAAQFEEMMQAAKQLAALADRCTPDDVVSQAISNYAHATARRALG